MNENILQRNLLALSSFDPQFTSRVSAASGAQEVSIIRSRSGHELPVIEAQPLHSKYDPIKEGEKLFSAYSETGFAVFLGFGAGYHILPFIKSKNTSHILIIDKNMEQFRRIVENIDLREIFLDNRVKFLIDETPESVKEYILKNYIPAVAGNLTTIPLYARLNREKGYFTEVVDSIKGIISQVADDYTVQAHFGKKWFSNTLLNLEAAEASTTLLKPARNVIVTGAGPSLEIQIPEIKKIKKESCLIATDTSLPTLMSFDLIPDMVISIDCQQISYHHFLGGLPKEIPLILDLASPPILTRLTNSVIFFSSGHPLSQYTAANWRKFPSIDTSGGNVSHAAMSLADSLGAQKIYLAGMDFSFPEGKTYARGSYQYHYFRNGEHRLSPLESSFFFSIFRNKKVIKERINNYYRYTTKPMINYKERLERAVTKLDAEVIAMKGKGMPLLIPHKKALKREQNLKQLFTQGPALLGWKDFLLEYRSQIKALPPPYSPVIKYLNDLPVRERELWITQYPAAASIKEYDLEKEASGREILEATWRWSLSRIEEVLIRKG